MPLQITWVTHSSSSAAILLGKMRGFKLPLNLNIYVLLFVSSICCWRGYLAILAPRSRLRRQRGWKPHNPGSRGRARSHPHAGDEAFLTAVSAGDVAFSLLSLSDERISSCVVFSVSQAASPCPGRADLKGAVLLAQIHGYLYPWQPQDCRPAEGQTCAPCFSKCFPS